MVLFGSRSPWHTSFIRKVRSLHMNSRMYLDSDILFVSFDRWLVWKVFGFIFTPSSCNHYSFLHFDIVCSWYSCGKCHYSIFWMDSNSFLTFILLKISFFVGQVGNEALNFILKRIIKEGRPLQIPGQANVNTSYGWPSSHCQFQSFFFVYSTFCIVFRLLKNSADIPKWFLVGLICANTSALAFVVHSRFVISNSSALCHIF